MGFEEGVVAERPSRQQQEVLEFAALTLRKLGSGEQFHYPGMRILDLFIQENALNLIRFVDDVCDSDIGLRTSELPKGHELEPIEVPRGVRRSALRKLDDVLQRERRACIAALEAQDQEEKAA